MVINGGSREEGLGGAEFQRGAQILKINRISLAYHLTSNKDQAYIPKNVVLFSCYPEEYTCQFCAIFGRFWGMVTFGPFGFAPEGLCG